MTDMLRLCNIERNTMYIKFKHMLKYISLVGILCACVIACGNADGQSAAEQSGTEIIQESLEETPIPEPESIQEPEPESSSAAESIPKPEPEQRQWQVYIQPDMPEPFIEVLKQYEEFMNTDTQILNEDAWWDEFNTVDGERGNLLWELCGSLMSLLKDSVKEGEEEAFRYSLTDLTGDGFPELIMGYYSDLFDEDYLYVVYYYSETEGIKMEWHTSYFSMSLYEGGIIEYISGGVNYTITYLRFQGETESWELADRIIVDWNSQDDSESYYRGVNTADFSDPDNEPMSEEEYQEIIERYTAEPVELEWIPLFCGETSDGKAE